MLWKVSPVTLPRRSFTDCKQMTGEANIKNCEKAGVQFTAITWQETQMHKRTRTFEFNYRI